MRWFKRYNRRMLPFDFHQNKEHILEEVNKRIKLSKIEDPKGFTLIEGIIMTQISPVLREHNQIGGKLFPQVAIVGNSSGIVYYFYLEKLFPGQGLD